MTHTAELKEHRIKKYGPVADLAIRRITKDGLGEVRVIGYPLEDERVIRTALRRHSTAAGIPVTVTGGIGRGMLFLTRTDIDYSEPGKPICADPTIKLREANLRDLYSTDPAAVARRERVKALRVIDVRDVR